MITERQYARDVTADDIRELISTRQRELNDLEYKVSPDGDLIKAACGIANAGGGFILIGIDEDSDHCASGIVHVANVNGVADSVRQRLRDGLAPRPVIEVLPLNVDGKDIVIVRVSPQNPPHMVSHEKRTDFYGRYDATTERMRYEEIEQRFREKHESGQATPPETVRVVIETIGGRTAVSAGAKGALEDYISRLRARDTSAFALIAVSDGNAGAINEDDAVTILSAPLYVRQGGWQVAHDKFDVTRENGIWTQRYGDVSTTTINPSGDAIFLKPVDEVLCWTQSQTDYMRAPRVYPNALVEYCLSFSYLIADIVTRTHPERVLAIPLFTKADGITLPLGEGGSVWFDSPVRPPNALRSSFVEGLPIAVDLTNGKPLSPRHFAFRLASQLYSFFGYLEKQVAFAYEDEITIESDPDASTLTSIRSYLQNLLWAPLTPPRQDFETDVYRFATKYMGKRYLIGVSEEFVDDHHWSEKRLFGLLEEYRIREFIQKHAPKESALITQSGIVPVPRTK